MRLSEELSALVAGQAGLVTRAQLRDHGVTRARVRWALAHQWRCVLPTVIVTSEAPLDPRQKLVAAQLHAGVRGVVSSLTAAEWHGVTAAAAPRIHMVVPFGAHARSEGFVEVHRTRHPEPDPWPRGPLVVSAPARATVDAARIAVNAQQARAIVIEAVQRRIVTVPMVRHELEIGAREGSAKVRAALAAAEAGAWSVPEADLLAITERSTVLPSMWLNPTLVAAGGRRLPVPDGWFDDVGLAVQVHSFRYHSSMSDWNATVMADSVFAAHGVALVPVTPDAIRRSPGEVLRSLEAAYRQASRRPRPPVSAVPSGCLPSARERLL